jgi:UDP-glucose 4-epimerase
MNWAGERVLVTGGAGFVPSHVTDLLVGCGADVTVIDNLQAGKFENLLQVKGRVKFLEQDIRDVDAVRKAVDGCSYVFHLAANASVPGSVKDPRYDFESNAVGTFNILEAARDFGAKRVVYASSAAVYGEPQYVPTDENHPLQPTSFYGLSKLTGERLGMMYHRMYDLGFSAIRIFNTYGPRQPRYVLADLVRKLKKNPHELEVLGTGEQVRDYSYATDTASAFIAVAECEQAPGEAYNVAGGNPTSIKELVALILKVMDLPDCKITYTGQSWKGDIDRLIADIGKIRSIGFASRRTLEEGIRLTIDSGTIVGESEF